MEGIKAEKAIVKPSKTGVVPVTDVNFGKVITLVSKKWTSSNWLTLQWLTLAEFDTNATNYNTVLSARLKEGSTRPQITKALGTLDKIIDGALSYIKIYITEKYKKENATSYYPEFGIEYKANNYLFPPDQNKRLLAIGQVIAALQTHGFESKEYGVEFWTPIQAQYKLLLEQAVAKDGGVSVKVGDKNALKNNLKKGLNAIVNALKANYPDSYKQELRNWGFQKEKY